LKLRLFSKKFFTSSEFEAIVIFSLISFFLNLSLLVAKNFAIFFRGPTFIPNDLKSGSGISNKISPEISSFIKLFLAFSSILKF